MLHKAINMFKPTKKQNELWTSLDKDKRKSIVILYNERKYDEKNVRFLETLYGKENLVKEKI